MTQCLLNNCARQSLQPHCSIQIHVSWLQNMDALQHTHVLATEDDIVVDITIQGQIVTVQSMVAICTADTQSDMQQQAPC